MKVKFLPVILLLLVGVWLPAGSVFAQDRGLSPGELVDPSHSELNLNDDKSLLVDRDSIMLHSKPSPVQPTLGTKSKSSDPKSITNKEEDDALSFNFLYYIIQKFKISDLIDE